jgi:hypothetical protein
MQFERFGQIFPHVSDEVKEIGRLTALASRNRRKAFAERPPAARQMTPLEGIAALLAGLIDRQAGAGFVGGLGQGYASENLNRQNDYQHRQQRLLNEADEYERQAGQIRQRRQEMPLSPFEGQMLPPVEAVASANPPQSSGGTYRLPGWTPTRSSHEPYAGLNKGPLIDYDLTHSRPLPVPESKEAARQVQDDHGGRIAFVDQLRQLDQAIRALQDTYEADPDFEGRTGFIATRPQLLERRRAQILATLKKAEEDPYLGIYAQDNDDRRRMESLQMLQALKVPPSLLRPMLHSYVNSKRRTR